MSLKEASEVALQALNMIQDTNFQRMEEIEKQFSWSVFYFYGTDLNKPSDELLSDPRWLTVNGDKSYSKFANENNAEQQILFIDSNGDVGHLDFNGILNQIINLIDLTTGKAKDEKDVKLIGCYFGALKYFGKDEKFKEILRENGFKTPIINKMFDQFYIDFILTEENMLQNLIGKTKNTFKKVGGIFYPKQSFAPSELVLEYNSIKNEYRKNVERLFEILENSNSLTLCYAQTKIGDVNIKDNDDCNLYLQTQAVANCCEETIEKSLIDNEIPTSNSLSEDEIQKIIKKSLEDLEKKNESLLEKLREKNKKRTIILSVIICIIFSLIILLLFRKKM